MSPSPLPFYYLFIYINIFLMWTIFFKPLLNFVTGFLVLRFIFLAQGMWDLGGSMVKNTPANAGDTGSTPGLTRSPGGRHGNPVQYSCLGNPMDRRAWRAAVHGVTESQAQQLLVGSLFPDQVSNLHPLHWKVKS